MIDLEAIEVKRREVSGAMSAAELRAHLSKLGPKAVEILQDVLNDPKAPQKLKVEVSMYVIDTTLDDPGVLQNNGDSLVKLAEVLRAQNTTRLPARAQRDEDAV